MFVDGDDAGRCSNGLTAQRYRDATSEERVTYRKWLRGVLFLCCALLFISGALVANYSGTGRTEITNLSVHQPAGSPRAD